MEYLAYCNKLVAVTSHSSAVGEINNVKKGLQLLMMSAICLVHSSVFTLKNPCRVVSNAETTTKNLTQKIVFDITNLMGRIV